MKRNLLHISLLLMLVSCGPGGSDPHKPVITVTILPQQYFIERIAGDLVEVNVMIPPGASPATYEPSVAQLSKLNRSEIYMRMGYVGFELSWLNKILSVHPGMRIVDLSEGIEPIRDEEDQQDHADHDHGTVDPHIWMSVANARIIARNIYRELVLLLPDEEVKLTSRYDYLGKDLDSLQLLIEHAMAGMEETSFMIYHPALTYFARDHGLEQYALELGGKTPSPAHMRKMVDLGRDKRISKILIQEQFDRKNAEILAREIGAEIIQINPLDPDWYSQMIHIANQFSTAY